MPNRSDYAKIAIACKELGLDRKQFLSDRYGIESAKELTASQLADLYKHFYALGFRLKFAKRPQNRTRKGYIHISSKDPGSKQKKKILAMWKELGYEVESIHHRCNTQFGIARFERLSDHDSLHIFITDLENRLLQKKICRRENA